MFEDKLQAARATGKSSGVYDLMWYCKITDCFQIVNMGGAWTRVKSGKEKYNRS